MNLFKKILGGVKKREAGVQPATAPIPASAPKRPLKAVLAGVTLLGLVVAGAAAWLWWDSRQQAAAPANVTREPSKPITAPQPVMAPSAPQPEMEATHVAAVSQPEAAATQDSLPKEPSARADEQVKSAPAQPPEPEALPPSEIPAKPPVSASRSKRSKAALPKAEAEGLASDEEAVSSVPSGGVDKRIQPLTLQQQAENEFRRANGLMQQGRGDEARVGYEAALQLDPAHEAARQALAVLLLQDKRNADAERVLQDGLKRNVKQRNFAMLLARIQIERDASWSALLTLQKTLPYAERQADYRAFVAALLQRLGRHKEAISHYQAAVQLSPNSGVWWMGLGISLRALQRNEDARFAFSHALESRTLDADLEAFVTQQLNDL